MIRTGCKEFSQSLMVLAQKRGLKFQEAKLWSGGRRVDVLEEEDVFSALGIPWVPPERRTPESGGQLLR